MKRGLFTAAAALLLVGVPNLPTSAQSNAPATPPPASAPAPAVAPAPAAGPYAEFIARSNALTQAQRDEAQKFITMGTELAKDKNCRGAEKAFQQGLKIDPLNTEGNYGYGLCLEERKSLSFAYDYFKRAATLGSTSKYQFAAQAATERFPPETRAVFAMAEIWLAQHEFDDRRLDSAIEHCTVALVLQPGSAEAKALLIQLKMAANHFRGP